MIVVINLVKKIQTVFQKIFIPICFKGSIEDQKMK